MRKKYEGAIMSLYQAIENDMKTAMKEGNALKLSVLRMLISALKTMAIEKNVKEPAESDILQVLRRQIKQHKESIEQFGNGKRQDLAEKELKELRILEGYMPKQLSEDELATIIKAAIAETGASARQDMGKVMKVVMEKAAGRCDGKIAQQLVMNLLK